MDFSTFRHSGDLSDVTVVVEQNDFKLHKFPLFAKSDYFCEFARNNIDTSRVELRDFPGGFLIFDVVADFFYNMRIEMTKSNIIQLCCAAEYLGMAGADNLKEVTQKFLHDTMTSCKMSRSLSSLTSLLMHCNEVGRLAETTGVVDGCVDMFVDTWMKSPTRFTSPTQDNDDSGDAHALSSLSILPVTWFVKVLRTSRDRGISEPRLTEFAVNYISNALAIMPMQAVNSLPERLNASEEAEAISGDIGSDGNAPSPCDLLKDTEHIINVPPKQNDIAAVLDAVILELPPNPSITEFASIECVTEAFQVAVSKNCKCKLILLKVVSDLLRKLSSEDLCMVSPTVIHDVLRETMITSGGDATSSTSVLTASCKMVDMYMYQLATTGKLNPETFIMLASVVPSEFRECHDKLFNVVEAIIEAGKDKLTLEERQELLDLVDFRRLTEDALHRSYEHELVPASFVAKAALALCVKLRAELDSVKCIAQLQEEELQKLYAPKTPTPRETIRRTPSRDKLQTRQHCATPPSSRSRPNSPVNHVYEGATSPLRSPERRHMTGVFEQSGNNSPIKPLASTPHMMTSSDLHRHTASYDSGLSRLKASSAYTYRPIPLHMHDSEDDPLDLRHDVPFRSLDVRRRQPTNYRYSLPRV